jgi:hypothetical protein
MALSNSHELAWAAGFFDGEGNIRAKRVRWRTRSYVYPAIFIPQIHPYALERFQHAVGCGKVSGPYTSSQRDGIIRQPQWYYQTYGFKEVQPVVIAIWPWLGPVKRAQARAAMLASRRESPALIVRGEAIGNSKLTAVDVIRIRSLRAQGYGASELGRMLGVTSRTIRDVLTRKTWAHVFSPVD